MEVLIVSGMSGAGKSKAAACLEDLGFYCVDNMPIELIPQFVDIAIKANHQKVMLVMDVRTSKDFSRLFEFIEEKQGVTFQTVFLDAKNDCLVNRYKESRRKHPMDKGGQALSQSIAEERILLEPIRAMADFEVDTSVMSTSDLRDHMLHLFLEKKTEH